MEGFLCEEIYPTEIGWTRVVFGHCRLHSTSLSGYRGICCHAGPHLDDSMPLRISLLEP